MTADRPDLVAGTSERQATIDPASLVPGALAAGVFRGRPVSVLGFARSGIALARFLADAGAIVTVYDARPASELARAVAALEGRPARLLLGPDVDPREALAGASLVATSPSCVRSSSVRSSAFCGSTCIRRRCTWAIRARWRWARRLP